MLRGNYLCAQYFRVASDVVNIYRRRANNEVGLTALPTSEKLRDDPEYRNGAMEAEMEGDQEPGTENLEMQRPRLMVKLRFTRGLSSIHDLLVGDTADPSLYQSLKMREHAIEAGERKHGSAAFLHQDNEQKDARERQVRQAREAELGRDQLEDAEKDRAYARGSEIHLGMLDQEAGGGIGEDAADLLHKKDMHGELGDERDWDDEDELGEDAAHPAVKGQNGRDQRVDQQRENFRSDRLHERGIIGSICKYDG